MNKTWRRTDGRSLVAQHALLMYVTGLICRARAATQTRLKQLAADQRGQGTTEYAILVGVLVVIAIIAVLAFRDNLQTLWTSIADGINSL